MRSPKGHPAQANLSMQLIPGVLTGGRAAKEMTHMSTIAMHVPTIWVKIGPCISCCRRWTRSQTCLNRAPLARRPRGKQLRGQPVPRQELYNCGSRGGEVALAARIRFGGRRGRANIVVFNVQVRVFTAESVKPGTRNRCRNRLLFCVQDQIVNSCLVALAAIRQRLVYHSTSSPVLIPATHSY